MKMNCIIIDDEPIARNGLEEYVKEVEFLVLVAKCESATKALPYLQDGLVDLIFVDIQMPKLSGIEFLKSLTHPPMAIFTTAFADYALEGYVLDVIDYLLKPIPFHRFLKATQKALDFHKLKHREPGEKETSADYFFVKCDNKYEKVFYREVQYLEALQNYTVIHTLDRKLITYITFTGLIDQLPAEQFLRVHKSYTVAISKITAIEGNEITMNKVKIPVSRNLKDEVWDKILKNNLLKR
jgi:DNA-binding LytR/AlgR family response regulator